MAGKLDGTVAIVTGAAGYLGTSHSLHLARAGAKVVVTDIADGSSTVEAIKEEGGEAVFMKLDVTDFDEAQKVAEDTVDQFGRIDILVNNAAIVDNIQKPWTEFTPEEWDKNLEVDLKGMFLCARAVYPAMKEQGSGKIINISSGTMMLGFPNFLPYVSAKAGAIGFTRTLASEVGIDNICVNAIIVGLFPHEMAGVENMEAMTEQVKAMQAIKRIGQPHDLSPTVVFLASEDSNWITGQAIAVDGGLVRSGG